MAKKTIIHVVDDVDGTVLGDGEGETVHFALDGTTYEIDLSDANAAALRAALAPYVDRATKVKSTSAPRSRRRSRGSVRTTEELAEIRAWLAAQGHEVSPRGRIRNDLLALYADAH